MDTDHLANTNRIDTAENRWCIAVDKPAPSDCSEKNGSPKSSSSSLEGSEDTERGNWGGKLDFLLSCIGYAVGLGNIWRFPYLCYRNGGATFLIPYFTFMILCGIPLFCLEVCYGQFSSRSPVAVWKLSPLFKGIGWGMVIISGLVCVYYNIIITWTLYYLFRSFTSYLPWTACDQEWNSPNCYVYTRNDSLVNDTNSTNITHVSPSQDFWEQQVLKLSDGINNMGGMRWELFGCLVLAWVMVFLCLCKGVQSSGKVVYVTATFPYLVLVILLIRGVTLDGAYLGIRYYLLPNWHKLLEFKVWGEAASQIFYSVGAAWGALVTMASYNKFRHNCYQDAIVVPLINCGTSVFAGFVIFAIIGFIAHSTGRDVEDVVSQGPGLIFVVYPAAIAKMPIAPLWSILFFLMILTLGLDSQFGMFETLTSALIDEFPDLFRRRKLLVIAGLCVFECILGIPMCMEGGQYVLQIMDWYSSTFSLMVLSFLELVVISHIYGIKQFLADIQFMIGRRLPLYFQVMWIAITPVVIIAIWGFNLITHTPVTLGEYKYPKWSVLVGWVLALTSIVPLFAIAIYKIFSYPDSSVSLFERLKTLVRPTPEWGPALDRYREEWLDVVEQVGKYDRHYFVKSLQTSSPTKEQEMEFFKSEKEPMMPPPPRYDNIA